MFPHPAGILSESMVRTAAVIFSKAAARTGVRKDNSICFSHVCPTLALAHRAVDFRTSSDGFGHQTVRRTSSPSRNTCELRRTGSPSYNERFRTEWFFNIPFLTVTDRYSSPCDGGESGCGEGSGSSVAGGGVSPSSRDSVAGAFPVTGAFCATVSLGASASGADVSGESEGAENVSCEQSAAESMVAGFSPSDGPDCSAEDPGCETSRRCFREGRGAFSPPDAVLGAGSGSSGIGSCGGGV